MRIERATSPTIVELWTQVEPRVQQSTYLEEAAQALASALHEQFKESVVVARIFVTVPFGALPPTNREYVQKLAESAGAKSELKATTPVLSFIGTHGQEEDWTDRRKSRGHVGIPLISAAFVDAIPMISRLFKELGIPVDWVDSHDSEMIINTIGSAAGLFFVENAATATDQQGRKIIAAQDFVSDCDVKSVFGVGGAYSGGEIMVFVVFCRDAFPRTVAERFLALANLFISKTTALVGPGQIFVAEAESICHPVQPEGVEDAGLGSHFAAWHQAHRFSAFTRPFRKTCFRIPMDAIRAWRLGDS